MRHYFLAFVCSLFFISICNAETESTAKQAPDENIQVAPAAEEIDEVLIIGEQPGPNLWKIYKGDHILWVLGTFSPLPQQLQWRSKQAEKAIAQSQEVLLLPITRSNLGFFKQLTILPSLIGLGKSPDGKSLQEKVPADTYSRWLELKAKYIGKDSSIEKLRPVFAGHELLTKAQKKAGFETRDMVVQQVVELAKKHKVKITTPTIYFPMTNPRQTFKNFKKTEIDDIACFTKMLDHLSTDLDNMRLRANAWATGDLGALAQLPITDHGSECFQAFMKSSFVEDEGIKDLPEKVSAEWFAKIDEALTNNASSFAVLPTHEMLKQIKVINKLKAKGYRIEGFGFDAPPSD
jgi:uncharacterized protein YbaP (TraB family)